MRTTTDLIHHAHTHGITIIWALDLPERGRWIDGARVIALRHGMTERRTVSTLAHELAHAHHGDVCSTPSAEARAWQWAARLLIDDDAYAHAEALHPSAGAIAVELGVTTDVITAYQHTLRTSPCHAAQ